MLIIIEGRDGVGKTTFAKRLVDILISKEVPVTLVREPVDRACLQAEDPVEAFAADRTKQSEEVTVPALCRGEVVVSDRSVFSSLAYQNLEADDDVEQRILERNAPVVWLLRNLASRGLLYIVLLNPPDALRPSSENIDDNDKDVVLQEKVRLRFSDVLTRVPPEIRGACVTVTEAKDYDAYAALLARVSERRHLFSTMAPAPHLG